jgi:biotin transport system substrate-specific component
MFRNWIHWQSPILDGALLTGMGTALLCWLSPQVWMFQGDLPITPQSLMVVLWGVLWGWKVGTSAVVLYLIAGGLGAPVFAEGAAGWQHFTGSTSGFLLAFPIATLVVGWLGESAHKMRYATSVLLLLLGQGIVVMLGLMWFRSIVPVEHGWIDTLAGLAPAIMVKTALGSLVVVVVGRILTQHRSMSSSTDGP